MYNVQNQQKQRKLRIIAQDTQGLVILGGMGAIGIDGMQRLIFHIWGLGRKAGK